MLKPLNHCFAQGFLSGSICRWCRRYSIEHHLKTNHVLHKKITCDHEIIKSQEKIYPHQKLAKITFCSGILDAPSLHLQIC